MVAKGRTKNQRYVAVIYTWLLYRDPPGTMIDQGFLERATFIQINIDATVLITLKKLYLCMTRIKPRFAFDAV